MHSGALAHTACAGAVAAESTEPRSTGGAAATERMRLSAAAGWSRRPGFSFTKTAIWRTSPGTIWPTGIPVDPEQASVRALTGRQPNLKLSETGAERHRIRLQTLRIERHASGQVRCRGFRSHPAPGNSLGCANPRLNLRKAPALLLEINDVRVHTASTRTALVIPPESRVRRGTVTRPPLWQHQEPICSGFGIREISDWHERASSNGSPASIAARPARSRMPLRKSTSGYPLFGRTITADDLQADEYRALIGGNPRPQEKTRTS